MFFYNKLKYSSNYDTGLKNKWTLPRNTRGKMDQKLGPFRIEMSADYGVVLEINNL